MHAGGSEYRLKDVSIDERVRDGLSFFLLITRKTHYSLLNNLNDLIYGHDALPKRFNLWS